MSEKDKLFKVIRYIIIGVVIVVVVRYAITFGIAIKLYLDNKEVITDIVDVSDITDTLNIPKSDLIDEMELSDQQQFENYLRENNISVVTENYYSILVEQFNLIGYTNEDFKNLNTSLRQEVDTQGGQLGRQYLGYYFKWNESK